MPTTHTSFSSAAAPDFASSSQAPHPSDGSTGTIANHAVFLDRSTIDLADLDLSGLQNVFGSLRIYAATEPEEIVERLTGCRTVLTNKVKIDAATMDACPDLKLILVLATGVNNIDMDAARERGIAVYNCQGYGTAAVAQHTMVLLLALATRLDDYQAAVRAGEWQRASMFCLLDFPILELEGKTLGLFGLGELGGAVKRLAEAFGMRVLIGQTPGRAAAPDRIPMETLLPQIDALTLHCPLNDQTRGMIGERELAMMKPHALVVNTARGGLIDEAALARALRSGHLGGAACDGLSVEPPRDGNVLLSTPPIARLIITPHSAWGSREARQRIINQTIENAEHFATGAVSRVATRRLTPT